MKPEFEEKQFEQNLNIELLAGSNLLYAPGQVLENTLGFDAALMTRHPEFWRLFSPPVPSGRFIDSIWYDLLEDYVEYFPEIKFNAFIQHKRPHYLRQSNAKEWNYWNRPYYRFSVVKHQQSALHDLENRIGNRGVVVYACPAFYKRHDLWKKIQDNQLVKYTNFCQASKLNNHARYSYINPGNNGKAHSEVEEIESFDFPKRLKQLSKIKPYDNNKQAIIHLGLIINDMMLENKDLSGFYRMYLDYYPEYTTHKFALAMLQISTFKFLTGTTILLGY